MPNRASRRTQLFAHIHPYENELVTGRSSIGAQDSSLKTATTVWWESQHWFRAKPTPNGGCSSEVVEQHQVRNFCLGCSASQHAWCGMQQWPERSAAITLSAPLPTLRTPSLGFPPRASRSAERIGEMLAYCSGISSALVMLSGAGRWAKRVVLRSRSTPTVTRLYHPGVLLARRDLALRGYPA